MPTNSELEGGGKDGRRDGPNVGNNEISLKSHYVNICMLCKVLSIHFTDYMYIFAFMRKPFSPRPRVAASPSPKNTRAHSLILHIPSG